MTLTQRRVKPNVKRSYHHGDLRDSLVAEAKKLVAIHGVENISLRQVATNIGVSPSAAYHHFGDKDELLREAAQSAFDDLADFQEAALAQVPSHSDESARKRFRTLGASYIGFAQENPNLFRLAFGPYCAADETPKEESRPWSLLESTLNDLSDAGSIHPTMRPYAELLAWSSIHGAANLIIDGLMPEEALESVFDAVALALNPSTGSKKSRL